MILLLHYANNNTKYHAVVLQLEKKAREFMHMQRAVIDSQYRLVEDRNQWQLEVSQLQRQLEDTRRYSTQQKEAIVQLLAEVGHV